MFLRDVIFAIYQTVYQKENTNQSFTLSEDDPDLLLPFNVHFRVYRLSYLPILNDPGAAEPLWPGRIIILLTGYALHDSGLIFTCAGHKPSMINCQVMIWTIKQKRLMLSHPPWLTLYYLFSCFTFLNA